MQEHEMQKSCCERTNAAEVVFSLVPQEYVISKKVNKNDPVVASGQSFPDPGLFNMAETSGFYSP